VDSIQAIAFALVIASRSPMAMCVPARCAFWDCWLFLTLMKRTPSA
jgi:hypothetical protein